MTSRDETGTDREGEGKGKERRAGSGHRVLFEALVAVGGQGAGYEAESVDVSRDGMRLRTAYLPMPGDRLVCRFDGGTGEIAVRGEVVWCNEEARGGEFGVAFEDLDEATAKALRALVEGDEAAGAPEADEAQPAPKAASTKGHRVRLHIEGLGSPMKARVREGGDDVVHVGSALEFLKVGRTLELEDVDLGARREAWVDDVQVEVDPQSSVPQLVVSLRFDAVGVASKVPAKRDLAARVDAALADGSTPAKRASRAPARDDAPADAREAAPPTKRAAAGGSKAARPDEDVAAASDATEEEDEVAAMRRGKLSDVGDKLKSGASVAMGKIAPAMSGLGDRAKSLWGKAQEGMQRRREKKEEDKPRRVTAPAPSGALRATGRKVVRDEDGEAPESAAPPARPDRRRTAAIGAIVGLVAVLGIFGVTRMGADAPEPMTAAELRKLEAPADAMPAIPGGAAVAEVPLFGATPLSTTEQVVMPPAAISGQAAAGAPPGSDEEGEEEDEGKPSAPAERKFGQGEVKNAKVLRIKMDGPIAGIHGEEIDGGFTITVPGRKSAASIASLARKDKRIDAIDVVNKEDAAVLTLKFKGDEVPAYLAQVKGDRLEIALGGAGGESSGPAKKVASKSKKKGKSDSKKKK